MESLLEYEKACHSSSLMGEANDCAVIAISIIAGISYKKAHKILKSLGRVDKDGTYPSVYIAAILKLGFDMEIVNERYSEHKTIKTLERYICPNSNFLVTTRGHILAIKNGVVQDHSRGSRRRVKCIYKIIPKLGKET